MKHKNITTDDFLIDYKKNIASCLDNDFRDNWDEQRFGAEDLFSQQGFKLRVKQLIKKLLDSVGIHNPTEAATILLKPNIEHFQWTYQRLADNESRQLMVQILSFRALGYRRVKLPINNSYYWDAIDNAKKLMANSESMDLGWQERSAYKIDLSSLGYNIELFHTPNAVVCLFILHHYECELSDKVLKAEEGDVVIDAGGCWGDTALYFANEVGKYGKVYSFEFMPESLKIFQQNISLNPALSQRIHLVRSPLWSISGKQLFVEGNGPGTRVVPNSSHQDAIQVETSTIDDFINNEKLKHVDFIKMDIEGAELEALRGAESTLRQFRPKLAISLYHKLNDFWEIPQYIDSLGLGYKFVLRHFTIHAEETVLFAY